MSFGAAHHDLKEQIRQAVDIGELIGSYLPLRRQGRIFVAHCPWHDDTRPSLQVNPDRQSWKCWVCDIGGDVFSFLMRRESVGFREALQLLADRAGISLEPSRPERQVAPGSPQDVRTLYRAMAWAEDEYHRCLLESRDAERARRYLDDRGVTQASIERFRLGYAPNGWQWLLERGQSQGFSPAVLQAVGLIGKSAERERFYDRFRGRVLFSIRDPQGRPIAFGGRILPGDEDERSAKYINSPETRLFKKSEQLYGLDQARDRIYKTGQAVVVEGYTDVIMAHQYGLENVIAVLGTAMTPVHVRQLRALADRIVLVLDGDEAGQRRTNEILELFVSAEVDLRVLTLPGGLDPCDFLLEYGAAPFLQHLESAHDALEHKVRVETRGMDLVNETHRAYQALERVLDTIAKAPRLLTSDAGRRIREDQMLTRLAREFHLPETKIRQRLLELRGKSRGSEPRQEPAAGPRVLSQLDPKEVELLEILLQYPELVPQTLAELPADIVTSSTAQMLLDVYRRLTASGAACDFQSVMIAVDDPQLKNLLVQLDDDAAERAEHSQLDGPARLESLIREVQQRRVEDECRRTVEVLERDQPPVDEQERILLQLQQKLRERHGITGPTDGSHAVSPSQVPDPQWGAEDIDS